MEDDSTSKIIWRALPPHRAGFPRNWGQHKLENGGKSPMLALKETLKLMVLLCFPSIFSTIGILRPFGRSFHPLQVGVLIRSDGTFVLLVNGEVSDSMRWKEIVGCFLLILRQDNKIWGPVNLGLPRFKIDPFWFCCWGCRWWNQSWPAKRCKRQQAQSISGHLAVSSISGASYTRSYPVGINIWDLWFAKKNHYSIPCFDYWSDHVFELSRRCPSKQRWSAVSALS